MEHHPEQEGEDLLSLLQDTLADYSKMEAEAVAQDEDQVLQNLNYTGCPKRVFRGYRLKCSSAE